MAWLTQSYLENKIGVGQVSALGLSTAGILSQFELEARATVLSAMQYAGYPDPGSTLTDDLVSTGFLRKLVSGIVIRDAYACRKGIQLSRAAQDAITESTAMLDAIHQKRLPIPGMTPASRDGFGGSKFSPTTGTGARPTRFGRDDLGGM